LKTFGIVYPELKYNIKSQSLHQTLCLPTPTIPTQLNITTMSSLSGRVVAITGAASGIGLATAHLLASHGCLLSLADLNSSALSQTETDMKQACPNARILTYPLDVRKESEVSAWVSKTIEVFGRLDGAANLAGVIGQNIGVKGVEEQDVDEWDFILDVNLKGVMVCLKHELKVMKEGGSVVNASSIAGLVGM
jgi:NAD(P)-dependent dehydrogenase (short-subunit alcohol dehydrogenase family)